MTTLNAEQVAELRAKIAAKYMVTEIKSGGPYCVAFRGGWAAAMTDHDDPLDAEAEMEAIIQDEVKAAIEEAE